MTPADAIKKIKELFNLPLPVAPVSAAAPAPPAPAPAAPTSYPLADGTTATISTLAIGGTVLVNGAAALDGDIALADGTTVSTIGGVITAVTPPAAASADDTTMAAVATLRAQFAAEKTQIEADKAAELKRVNDLFAAQKVESDNQNKILTEMFALVQLMAGEPVTPPADKAPKVEKKWEEMSALERFRASK